jgi:hypothetical protein
VAGRGNLQWLRDPTEYQVTVYVDDVVALIARLAIDGRRTIAYRDLHDLRGLRPSSKKITPSAIRIRCGGESPHMNAPLSSRNPVGPLLCSLLAALTLSACANGDTIGGEQGTGGSSSTGTGGTSTGTGGTGTGGTGTGGTGTGGTSTGGTGTGGVIATGGHIGTGGIVGTGGLTGQGGATATGGQIGSGGRGGGGGQVVTGGGGRGGATGSGGRAGGPGTGGTPATGGTSGTCSAGAVPSGGTSHCSSNQSGTVGSQQWTIWSSGGGGCLITYGSTAAFSATWNNSGDFLARVGQGLGSNKTYDQYTTIAADFAETKSGSGGGYSSIGVYGWSVSPLVEFYVDEDSYNNLGGSGSKMGTFTIDGEGTYDVYKHQQVNQPSIQGGNATFDQFISVRQGKRTCGHISLSKHFAAWKGFGMTLGKLEEAKILIEAGGGSGRIDFTTASVTAQ